MSEKRLLAQSDIYDVYERDGFAVREYKDNMYKEKCLYAALTHARVETTLVNSFIKIPTLHEVSVVDGRWSVTMDFIKGKNQNDDPMLRNESSKIYHSLSHSDFHRFVPSTDMVRH